MKNDKNETESLLVASVMQRYDRYKKSFPNKTDAQCIETLCYEVSDKVEIIHSLLKEMQALKNVVSFSLEDVLGLYVFVQKQIEFIIDKKEKSSLLTERLSLTFTANVLVDIMDEIHSLVELRENNK